MLLSEVVFWGCIISFIGLWILIFGYVGEKLFYRIMNFVTEDLDKGKPPQEETE